MSTSLTPSLRFTWKYIANFIRNKFVTNHSLKKNNFNSLLSDLVMWFSVLTQVNARRAAGVMSPLIQCHNCRQVWQHPSPFSNRALCRQVGISRQLFFMILYSQKIITLGSCYSSYSDNETPLYGSNSINFLNLFAGANPQLIQYALRVYGTTNLDEDKWRQCEDQIKVLVRHNKR